MFSLFIKNVLPLDIYNNMTLNSERRGGGGGILKSYHIPFIFIPNKGQYDSRVKYLAKGSDYSISFLKDGEIIFSNGLKI